VQTAALYNDFGTLAALRTEAQQRPGGAIGDVAGQFEALFVQMMLKSMREATMRSDLFSSSQLETYEQMYDQQLALELSKQGGVGLRRILVEQLGGASSGPSLPATTLEAYRGQALRTLQAPSEPPAARAQWRSDSPQAFIDGLLPLAEDAARELGVAPRVLLAQAALETGWGRHIAGDSRGSSNNLFNIKAGADWDGPAVRVSTLEYRDGVAQRESAAFRAYASRAESFADYVALINRSPRYQAARAAAADPAAYLQELQRAGYATDPAYADKVMDILTRDGVPWTAAALKNPPQLPLTASAADAFPRQAGS
jgi:flagellar protein FlgJ